MTISDCWFNGHMKLEIRGDNKITLLHCCYRGLPLDTKIFEEFKKINITYVINERNFYIRNYN